MQLRAVLGDLTGQSADAIVRVVGRGRRHQLGPDEHGLLAAAGPAVGAALEELFAMAHPNGLAPGQALSTTAGELPARWLIHVAVPASSLRRREDHVLAATYRTTLEVADSLGARTLALTPFGLTIPYWPLDTATRVGLSTLLHTLTHVREATLVVRTPAALDVLTEALARR